MHSRKKLDKKCLPTFIFIKTVLTVTLKCLFSNVAHSFSKFETISFDVKWQLCNHVLTLENDKNKLKERLYLQGEWINKERSLNKGYFENQLNKTLFQ